MTDVLLILVHRFFGHDSVEFAPELLSELSAVTDCKLSLSGIFVYDFFFLLGTSLNPIKSTFATLSSTNE